jgi:hypothetical protein
MKVGPDHGKMCMNPKKVDYCSDIQATNFPPLPEPVPAAPVAADIPSLFPRGDVLVENVHAGQQILV